MAGEHDRPRPYAWPAGWERRPAWASTYRLLEQRYGWEKAQAITRGEDMDAIADVIRWRGIGR